MSVKYMLKALECQVGSAARKLVLIKLCDNANDNGECFPSYQNIADHCEMTRRSVISHIQKLSDDGLVEIYARKTKKGNSSNVFKITIPSENISPPSENISPPPSENISPRTSHSINQSTNPVIEFDIFYSAYPKKVDRKKAEQKWNRLSEKTKQEAIDGIQSFVMGKETRFICAPTVYLNGERWNDVQETQAQQINDGWGAL